MKTRREFLVMAGGATVLAPRIIGSKRVPGMLDHILLGCSDLERGIAFVEAKTGVKAAFGGVHPGRGTQNALLSLGERQYLEIIAPDPKQTGTVGSQSSVERLKLRELAEPKLVTWAVHPGSAAELAERLKRASVVAEGPTPGSRKRPDGRMLEWKTVNLAEDEGGLLPFFIEWGAGTVHPSVDATKGCTLKQFWIESLEPEKLVKKFELMGVDVEVRSGKSARLRARITGPKGEVEL
ncbi:MAG TPA: VOC family protein [Candidatus Acidoferrum sp.]|nr:VOC family protein [Candidatus Acidoferrum sp.]